MSTKQKILYLTAFSLMTAGSFMGLWITLQVFTPKIVEANRVLDAAPELVGVVLLACGVSYVLKNLFN